jgi:hypothetical protein
MDSADLEQYNFVITLVNLHFLSNAMLKKELASQDEEA